MKNLGQWVETRRSESTNNQQQTTTEVVIFYWPQLLEFLGFGVLIIGGGWLGVILFRERGVSRVGLEDERLVR